MPLLEATVSAVDGSDEAACCYWVSFVSLKLHVFPMMTGFRWWLGMIQDDGCAMMIRSA